MLQRAQGIKHVHFLLMFGLLIFLIGGVVNFLIIWVQIFRFFLIEFLHGGKYKTAVGF